MLFTHLLSDTITVNAGGDAIFAGIANSGAPNFESVNGVWLDSADGDLSLVVSKGMTLPGTNPGETFMRTVGGRPFINDRGQIGFRAELAGLGINESNDEGIWIQDAQGVLQLIAREGQDVNITNDSAGLSTQNIAGLGYVGQNSFNARGELAFTASFTDGSEGVFVSSLVVVPEPSGLALAVACASLAGLFSASWRRQK
jgi:hypothetical protein